MHTHTHTHTHAHALIHTHTRARAHSHTHTHMRTCAGMKRRANMFEITRYFLNTQTYTHRYRQKHTHKYTPPPPPPPSLSLSHTHTIIPNHTNYQEKSIWNDHQKNTAQKQNQTNTQKRKKQTNKQTPTPSPSPPFKRQENTFEKRSPSYSWYNWCLKCCIPQAIPVETLEPCVLLDLSDPSTSVSQPLHWVVPASNQILWIHQDRSSYSVTSTLRLLCVVLMNVLRLLFLSTAIRHAPCRADDTQYLREAM